jgi:la-related protein 1
MYLRRKMDSQGFVSLEFIAGFNRIKHLSTDLELIKLVCQQSKVVQYRTGEDGQDRLRRREGWEQWVLTMADRDPVAQNDGPKELHQPPVPQPAGFDQSGAPQWPMSAVEPMGPIVSNASISPMNGYGHGSDQDKEIMNNSTTNGSVSKESNGVPNGHPVETSIKAVSPQTQPFLILVGCGCNHGCTPLLKVHTLTCTVIVIMAYKLCQRISVSIGSKTSKNPVQSLTPDSAHES